ncbi:MAG: hypothetical protein V4858_08230 [Pseudomonadota bacterium]
MFKLGENSKADGVGWLAQLPISHHHGLCTEASSSPSRTAAIERCVEKLRRLELTGGARVSIHLMEGHASPRTLAIGNIGLSIAVGLSPKEVFSAPRVIATKQSFMGVVSTGTINSLNAKAALHFRGCYDIYCRKG